MTALKIITQDIIINPAIIVGIFCLVGLIALKKPKKTVISGFIKPILGFLMLGLGIHFIASNLNVLERLIIHGFNISGLTPSDQVILSLSQSTLGKETLFIILIGLIFNLIIARITKFKYIFLSGHQAFCMAFILCAILSAGGIEGVSLILIAGFILGAWCSISPAIGQKYTCKVSNNEKIAMGHFGSLGYYLSGWIGKLVNKKGDDKEKTKVKTQKDSSILKNINMTTIVVMTVFYLIASLKAGAKFVHNISFGTNFIIFAILSALEFCVGLAVIYYAIKIILENLIPAFEGISKKVIPNSIPAVDCSIFFTYGASIVILGFIFSFIGSIIGMLILQAAGISMIIPCLIPHFFFGATAGIFGNATGGKKGAIIASLINGLIMSFLPALLIPIMGELGFEGTTFATFDFAVFGIVLGKILEWFSHIGVYILAIILALVLIIPNFIKTKSSVIK